MAYFNWKINYETGIDEIDNQHKRLFEIANKFYDELFSGTFMPDSNRILSILNELKEYSEFHCSFEKKKYSEDDFTNDYFDEGNKLEEKINVLASNYKKNDVVMLYGFAEFLRKWLLKHILTLNKEKFKDALKKDLINLSCN